MIQDKATVESDQKWSGTFENSTDSNKLETNLQSIKVAHNSNLGIVWFLRGSTLVFAKI